MRVAAEQIERLVQQRQHAAQTQHHAWQQPLQQWRGIGPLTHTPAPRQISLFIGRLAHQRGQVVSQHLGRHVDEQRMLGEAIDTLRFTRCLSRLKASSMCQRW